MPAKFGLVVVNMNFMLRGVPMLVCAAGLAGCASFGDAPMRFTEQVDVQNSIYSVEWTPTATGIFAKSSLVSMVPLLPFREQETAQKKMAAQSIAMRECKGRAVSSFAAVIEQALATQWKCVGE